MVQENILDALQREIILETDPKNPQASSPIVTLEGRNSKSAKALFNRKVTVRYFPFHIGRISPGGKAFLDELDLALEEHRPYHLSRLQAILVRRGKDIFIRDRLSRSGSLVNGRLLGKKAGGENELLLPPGRHEICLGGQHSPFVFTFAVTLDGDSHVMEDQVRIGDRTVPVSLLYHRLCQQIQRIFLLFPKENLQSLNHAHSLIQSILNHPEMIEPLYYFSAVPETFEDIIVAHSLNVAISALKLARTIPIAEEDYARFALAALFHDIGMYEVPLEIINKRDILTDAEYEIIKHHSRDGQTRLALLEDVDLILPTVAVQHHERINGKGYPMARKDLSEYVELIAMVDFFEALTHYRPQRGPLTPHEGMKMLIELRHGIFSPPMVKLFIKGFSLFPAYSVVRLNTGETGQVVATNPQWPLRPTVRIFFDRDGQKAANGEEIDLSKVDRVYIVKDISDRIFVDHYFKL